MKVLPQWTLSRLFKANWETWAITLLIGYLVINLQFCYTDQTSFELPKALAVQCHTPYCLKTCVPALLYVFLTSCLPFSHPSIMSTLLFPFLFRPFYVQYTLSYGQPLRVLFYDKQTILGHNAGFANQPHRVRFSTLQLKDRVLRLTELPSVCVSICLLSLYLCLGRLYVCLSLYLFLYIALPLFGVVPSISVSFRSSLSRSVCVSLYLFQCVPLYLSVSIVYSPALLLPLCIFYSIELMSQRTLPTSLSGVIPSPFIPSS